MAIDPKSLSAFATKNRKPSVVQTPEPAPEPEPAADPTDLYADLLLLLEENAADIEEIVVELDGESLTELEEDLSSDDLEALRAGYGSLPSPLRTMLRGAAGLSLEECTRLADSLESDGLVSDQERVCGWLWRTCQMLLKR